MPGLVILKELEIRGSFATTTPELSESFRLVQEKKVRPVVSKLMPLANRTRMTQEERDLVVAWVSHGSSTK